jgi:hypothetical protein
LHAEPATAPASRPADIGKNAAANNNAPPQKAWQPVKVRQVYFTDFERGAGPEWSAATVETTPKGNRKFLGQFAAKKVRLSLSDLPAHQFVRLSFDLYIINTRISISPFTGVRCFWATVLNGPKLIHSTFCGRMGNVQSFPELGPWSSFPAGTGAAENGSRGFPADQVYRMAACFPHQGKSLTLNFAGDDLGAPTDDTWGLCNVKVEIMDRPPNAHLDRAQLDKLCDELAGADAVKANHALWELVAAGDVAVEPILKRVFGWDTTAKAPNEADILKLIADLDQDHWQERDSASAKLQAMLPGASGTIHRVLAGKCSLEARTRLERILPPEQPSPVSPNGDPRIRGAWVLATLANTPQAVAVLSSIANMSGCAEVREIARLAAIRNSPTAIVDAEPKSSGR